MCATKFDGTKRDVPHLITHARLDLPVEIIKWLQDRDAIDLAEIGSLYIVN